MPQEKPKNASQIRLWDDPLPPAFWQPRYYDFNVYSGKKKREKLDYMHWNPVKRGLINRGMLKFLSGEALGA